MTRETGPFWDHGDDHECPEDERCSECGAIPLHILHASIDFDDAPRDCAVCSETLEDDGSCAVGCLDGAIALTRTVATREPSQVSQSRPYGRVSTIARGAR